MLQNEIKAKQQEPENIQDDYNESADEDYDPSASKFKTGGIENGDNNDEEEDDDEFQLDQSDKREMKKYGSIESDRGGLVKTRSQRIHEDNENKEKKFQQRTNNKTASNLNINSIWAELNGKTGSNLSEEINPVTRNNQELEKVEENKAEKIFTANSLNQIKIKRTFEFAGEMITEEKWVDANSEEAKAHLNSTKIENVLDKTEYKKPEKKGPLRRKRKRESLLDAVISNSSNTKLSTLEKSRLDWATYVDKNSISDELRYKNKSGFLEKQDFLDRVGNRQDSLYKDAKLKSSKQ